MPSKIAITIKNLPRHARVALEDDYQSNLRWLLRDFYGAPTTENRIKVEAALTEYQETFARAAGLTRYDRERGGKRSVAIRALLKAVA